MDKILNIYLIKMYLADKTIKIIKIAKKLA